MAEEERGARGRALRIRGLRQRWIVNSIMPILILLGLLGLAGSMIVSHMMSRRENAIYIICGIKNRSLIGVEWIRCGGTSFAACALVFVLSRTGVLRGFFDLTTYLLFLGIAAIFIAVILAIASTQIISANPIDELRRND